MHVHLINVKFLPVGSRKIHRLQATFNIFSLGHFDLNSHFKKLNT